VWIHLEIGGQGPSDKLKDKNLFLIVFSSCEEHISFKINTHFSISTKKYCQWCRASIYFVSHF